ncbi:MAG: DegT/DnrJ/EryC1/StrS family aminotransferase [Deltaproteobacteria bacterium]|nr:DegT/DnrJ/EryC1/StrS family aminotransferase [Deltaproteobacteria bacterium]
MRFETELKDYFDVKYCFLVSSGKAALTLILNALKNLYPDKDQVIIPAFTCYSVPSAIVRAGLKIELCDMDTEKLDFDFGQLSKTINNSLLCIIPAHLFGMPSDIDHLRSILGDNEAVVVEDAAQAMGGKWEGEKLGTFGDVSFFSLGRGKAISTVEGGVILTNRDDIAQNISALLNDASPYHTLEILRLMIEAVSLTLLMRPSLFWFPKALPCLNLGETIYDPNFKIRKMSPFQAGMAKSWKKKISKFQNRRSRNAKAWVNLLKSLKTNELSAVDAYPDSDLIRFPVNVDDPSLRKAILKQSEIKGLGIMPTYPDTINGIEELRNMFAGQEFPVAKKYSQQLITLPVHPFVKKTDIMKITREIRNAIKQTRRI